MQNRHIPHRYIPHRRAEELENQFAINEHIKAKMVRIVGDNLQNPGIFSIQEALKIAEEMGLDLIEISATAQPPVCKILDFQKFLYQQKKKQKELKAKTSKVVLKEIRFGPNTDDHDYDFKLKHAINFLQEGAKVKAYVFFRGRSIIYSEQGKELLNRFIKDLEEYGKLEMEPKLEGKRMIIMINPLPNKKKT
jgi:translation initiation factor IF-3